jgi:hypothetical protein
VRVLYSLQWKTHERRRKKKEIRSRLDAVVEKTQITRPMHEAMRISKEEIASKHYRHLSLSIYIHRMRYTGDAEKCVTVAVFRRLVFTVSREYQRR